MSLEHPIEQVIEWLQVDAIEHQETTWRVGRTEVTRIEACTKSGMHADIPYLRVWQGDHCAAEYCQHAIVGIGFKRTAL